MRAPASWLPTAVTAGKTSISPHHDDDRECGAALVETTQFLGLGDLASRLPGAYMSWSARCIDSSTVSEAAGSKVLDPTVKVVR